MNTPQGGSLTDRERDERQVALRRTGPAPCWADEKMSMPPPRMGAANLSLPDGSGSRIADNDDGNDREDRDQRLHDRDGG